MRVLTFEAVVVVPFCVFSLGCFVLWFPRSFYIFVFVDCRAFRFLLEDTLYSLAFPFLSNNIAFSIK